MTWDASGRRAGVMLGVLLAGMAQATTAWAQQPGCRQVCMPDEVRDANGCCASPTTGVPIGRDAPPQLGTVGCTAGMRRTPLSAGHCCWPEQVWGDDRCRGIPSRCPRGYTVDAARETCALTACPSGMTRASDEVSCCWPGQVFAGDRCRGVPRCPDGTLPQGEGCAPQTLRVEVRGSGSPSFDVSVTSVETGRRYLCATRVTRDQRCELPGVPPGVATIHVSGTRSLQQSLQVVTGTTTAILDYEQGASSTTLLTSFGIPFLGAGLALGGTNLAIDNEDLRTPLWIAAGTLSGVGLLCTIFGIGQAIPSRSLSLRTETEAPSPQTAPATGEAEAPEPPAGDRDFDGIDDPDDSCPDAREDRDGFRDGDGCPDPDNDNDGVTDDRDLCPNEPENRNGVADQDGCPESQPQ